MNQTVSVTAPITSLLGDLQDISSALAAVNAVDADDSFVPDDAINWPMPSEAWKHVRRVTALSQANICEITQIDLDRLVINYTKHGLLITQYEASIGATVYRRPDFSIIGMSFGDRHFCHRDVRPVQSPTLYIQALGRSKRAEWAEHVWTTAAPGHATQFFPLLEKEGGAGEGAAVMTSAMLAKYFGVPLNIGGPINTALLTDGINTPDSAK